MKWTLILFLSLAIQSIVWAQEKKLPLSLGLGGGVDIISNKDDSASPLNYRGFGLPIGLNGFKMSNKWINQFEIQLIVPFVTNNYPLRTQFDIQLINWAKVNLNYRLLYRFSEESHYFFGAGFQSHFFYREYDFLDGYGWEFQNNFNISLARKINLNQNSFLLAQIEMPFLAYINRKPSLTYDESFLDDFNNNGATSLLRYGEWRLQFEEWHAFNIDLLYFVRLSSQFSLQIKAGVNYYVIQFPEKVQNINLPIRCYINYHL